ncbi:hypothetical protein V8F33_006702 [Rhypophila sp. PSN 637]
MARETDASMSLLFQLPAEVLVNIVGLCNPIDIFYLGLTCHHLRAFCDDVQVLQQCFINHAPEPVSTQTSNKYELVKLIRNRTASLDPAQAKLTWLRLAVAATCGFLTGGTYLQHVTAAHMGSREAENFPRFPDHVGNTVGLMSTLAVLGYPLRVKSRDMTLAGLALLAAKLQDRDHWMSGRRMFHGEFEDTLVFAQSSFCLAIGKLYYLAAFPDNVDSLLFLTRKLSRSLYHRVVWHIANGRELDIFSDSGNYPFLFAQGLGMCIASRLVNHVNIGGVSTPFPHNFPWLAGMEIASQVPLPDQVREGPDPSENYKTRWMGHFGSSTSWADWLKKAVDLQVQDIGLGDSVWVVRIESVFGVPGYGHALRLRDIQWSAVPDSVDPGRINLKAENFSVGTNYSLRGVLSRETSQFTLLLQSQHTNQLNTEAKFYGALTPLGMAGVVRDVQNRTERYFWIYKKDWTLLPTTRT